MPLAKPLNEFGGWLRFFLVTCWLTVVACVIGIPVAFLSMVGEPTLVNILESASLLANAAVSLYYARCIIKNVKLPTVEAAGQIRGWLKLLLVLSVGFLALDLVIALWKHGWAWSEDASNELRWAKGDIGWPACWLAYFQQAKRVKAFYVQAAPAPAAAAPAPAPGAAPVYKPLEPS